jgi:hypothetical protein
MFPHIWILPLYIHNHEHEINAEVKKNTNQEMYAVIILSVF